MNMSRRRAAQALSVVALGVTALGFTTAAQAQASIKVGVLHSLSGTMAISETVLEDTVLITVDEVNAKGGCSARSSSRTAAQDMRERTTAEQATR